MFQFRNPSFDATSSANSTLQDSKRSSTAGINTMGGLVAENCCHTIGLGSAAPDITFEKRESMDGDLRQWPASASGEVDQQGEATSAVVESSPTVDSLGEQQYMVRDKNLVNMQPVAAGVNMFFWIVWQSIVTAIETNFILNAKFL